MTEVFGTEIDLPLIVVGPATVFVLAAAGWFAARATLALVARGVRRTPLEEIIHEAVRIPICVVAAVAGAWLALHSLHLSTDLARYVDRGWILLATVLLVSVGLRSINGLTKGIISQSPTFGPAAGMIRVVGRIIVLSVGLVMFLESLGIAVEPLIASLGIGSLAVALALRDTLSNFFAGVYLLADHPIRVGDYVKIDGGQEGYVHQIGWRATRIRMLSNNLIIVPNEKLAQSIVTNYDLPEPRLALGLPVSVAYDADPRQVMEILTEEVRAAAAELPGMLAEPKPSASFSPGFGQNSLDFSVNFYVRSYVDQYAVQSELRGRILARLRKEGISIPLPERTIRAPGIERILSARLGDDPLRTEGK